MCLSPLISIDVNKTTAVVLRLTEHYLMRVCNLDGQFLGAFAKLQKQLLASSCLPSH